MLLTQSGHRTGYLCLFCRSYHFKLHSRWSSCATRLQDTRLQDQHCLAGDAYGLWGGVWKRSFPALSQPACRPPDFLGCCVDMQDNLKGNVFSCTSTSSSTYTCVYLRMLRASGPSSTPNVQTPGHRPSRSSCCARAPGPPGWGTSHQQRPRGGGVHYRETVQMPFPRFKRQEKLAKRGPNQ